DTLGQRFRQEFAGLLAEIEQDRAGLEEADALAVRPIGIDDGGNLVVRADGQERRRHLLALGDVHRDHLVGQPHFLQRDRNLAPVRRIPGVQLDGHALFPSPRDLGSRLGLPAWALNYSRRSQPYNRRTGMADSRPIPVDWTRPLWNV